MLEIICLRVPISLRVTFSFNIEKYFLSLTEFIDSLAVVYLPHSLNIPQLELSWAHVKLQFPHAKLVAAAPTSVCHNVCGPPALGNSAELRNNTKKSRNKIRTT